MNFGFSRQSIWCSFNQKNPNFRTLPNSLFSPNSPSILVLFLGYRYEDISKAFLQLTLLLFFFSLLSWRSSRFITWDPLVISLCSDRPYSFPENLQRPFWHFFLSREKDKKKKKKKTQRQRLGRCLNQSYFGIWLDGEVGKCFSSIPKSEKGICFPFTALMSCCLANVIVSCPLYTLKGSLSCLAPKYIFFPLPFYFLSPFCIQNRAGLLLLHPSSKVHQANKS